MARRSIWDGRSTSRSATWPSGSSYAPGSGLTILLGFVMVSTGLLIQLSPGHLGQYELVWTFVFASLAVQPVETVITLGLLSHSLILLVIALLGTVSLCAVPSPCAVFRVSNNSDRLSSLDGRVG